jgi:protease I
MMSRKILMVIAPEAFRDEELLVPRAAFTQQGWTVDTASTRTGTATGMLGASESISLTLADVASRAYDAVIVVGGMGSPEHLWPNTELHGLLQTQAKQGRVVAAICLSGAVLANAGVLQGKQATVWEMPESVAALQAGGATFTGQPVTVDGNTVTANGPDAAQAFAEAVMARVNALTPVAS